MAMFGKWLGLGVIKDFPYDIGEEHAGAWHSEHWVLHKGTKHADSAEVSIFEFDKQKHSGSHKLALATNGWRKTKTLMLPGFLKCLDAVETPTHYYIATEPCTPLADVLATTTELAETETRSEFIAYGVYSIIQGLTHLHERNLMHGCVAANSVFCTKSGDWRLWGLDFVTNLNDPDSSTHLKAYSEHLPQESLAPELAKQNWQVIEKAPVHAIDAWALGCLIHEVYNGPVAELANPADMKKRKNIPPALYSSYTGLLSTAARTRADPAALLKSCDYFTEDPFIAVQKEIDTLTLKDQADRDSFFRRLADVVDTFPAANCKYTILPKLTTALTYGSGGAAALEPMLKIGRKLNEAEFTELVVPGVVQLFSSPDRHVRIKLLENIQSFAPSIPPKLLGDKIWPLLAQGFHNTVPEIRELTIKAMVCVVPRLYPTLVEEAKKNLIRLQDDPEGGIRTNATICLGMVAAHLPPSGRGLTLHKAFSRKLKDPFMHARGAAVGSYQACIEHFDVSLSAQGVLPVLAPCLVDPDRDVRSKATKAFRAFLAKVEAGQDSVQTTPAPSPAGAATPGAAAAPRSGPGDSPPPAASGGGGGGWGAWSSGMQSALSTVSAMAAKDGGGAAATPVAPAAAQQPPSTPQPPPAVAASGGGGGGGDAAWGGEDDAMSDDDDEWGSGGGSPSNTTPVAVAAPSKKFTPPSEPLAAAAAATGEARARPRGLGLGGMKLAAKPKKKGLGAIKKSD